MFSEKLGINYNISGNGKPIVLLNGIMMSVPSWAEHVKYLEKDFQVITYDMKDQGKSRYVDYQYDISMHVQDLRDLLTEIGIKKASLVGLSYGGQVAQLFALKHPEMVDKLVLSNTISHVDNFLKSIGQAWKASAATYDGEFFFDVSLPFIYSRYFYQSNYEWLMNRRKLFKATLTKQWFDGFIRLASSNETFDIREEIKNITAPTLLIGADEDIATPYLEMLKMNEKIPQSQIICIPKTAHAMFLEKLPLFCDLVKGFLKE